MSRPTERSKTRKDLVVAFSAEVLYKLIGFLILALLARHLAKERFGQFLFAVALAETLVLSTELGTGRYLIREAAATPARALELFSRVLTVRMPLLGAYFVLINGIALLIDLRLVPVVLLCSAWVGLKDLHAAFSSLFLARKRIDLAVGCYGGSLLLLLVSIWITLERGGGLFAVLACYVGFSVVLLAAGAVLARRSIGRFRWLAGVDLSGSLRRIVVPSLPFFGLAVLPLVHYKVDAILVGFFRPYSDVAAYEGAMKLFEGSRFLIRPLAAVLFPICSEMASHGRWNDLRATNRNLVAGVTLAGLAAAAAVWLLAAPLIRLVFGPGFESSAPILRILYLGAPGLYVAGTSTFVAGALHRERSAVVCLATGLGLNVALDALLIPIWGLTAAAWATVGTQAFVALWLQHLDRKALSRPDVHLGGRRARRTAPLSRWPGPGADQP